MAPGFKPFKERFFVQFNYMKIGDRHKLCEVQIYEKVEFDCNKCINGSIG